MFGMKSTQRTITEKQLHFYMPYTENKKIIYFNDIKSKKNTKIQPDREIYDNYKENNQVLLNVK